MLFGWLLTAANRKRHQWTAVRLALGGSRSVVRWFVAPMHTWRTPPQSAASPSHRRKLTSTRCRPRPSPVTCLSPTCQSASATPARQMPQPSPHSGPPLRGRGQMCHCHTPDFGIPDGGHHTSSSSISIHRTAPMPRHLHHCPGSSPQHHPLEDRPCHPNSISGSPSPKLNLELAITGRHATVKPPAVGNNNYPTTRSTTSTITKPL